MSNPRKSTYGYTFRIGTGIDMNDFNDISIKFSASCGNDTFTIYASTSQVFVGASVIYSSVLGQAFQSAEWVYGLTTNSEPFATADNYMIEVIASATTKLFLSRQAVLSVEP